jgi:class 3 adenylate cyclase/predicted ATPase
VSDNVTRWLEQLGLGQYTELFAENDIDWELLPELDHETLKDIGITSAGHRLRIIKAAGTLPPDTKDLGTLAKKGPAPTTSIPGQTEAERRQLTVMFCDLVGSTALSTKLDPEDMREVITSFQDTCREAIQRYAGFIARYMGDGILVYFGYPQAHEDDGERAVRAALAIVRSMAELNAGIGRRYEIVLAVRIGVATGSVVVGNIVGEGAAEEAAVVGETPNLAARLQGVAEPNQVMVASVTQRLLGGLFEYEDLGTLELKGIEQPVQAWRVVREGDTDSRYEAKRVGGRLPLVGRQEELGLLVRSWEAAKERHGQVVLIQGEAGIGKSRLLEALREQIAGQNYVWVAHRCSPYHANSTLAGLAGQSLPLAEVIPLYAELLSLPLPEERYEPSNLDPKQKREATLDAIAGWLLEMAEQTSVLNVFEDLQWADPTTLELLVIYLEQSPTVSMMNVLTYRPDFIPSWSMHSHMIPITLNRLERPEVEAMIGYQANGKAVPSEVVEHIVAKADGVPLFVEELTKTILESDYLHEEAERYTLAGSLSEVAIPTTLQDSLMARLDRLPTMREVAQVGAVLGREFAYEILNAIVGLEEPQLKSGLEQLVENELLYQRGRPPRSKYIFKHALVQDAAYQSLLRRTRHQYHERVARLLEARLGERDEIEPELLAYHYAGAGLARQAIEYWLKAARRAAKRSAYIEALAHLQEGIEQLDQLPSGDERTHQALRLQVERATALLSTKGMSAPETGKAYNFARELCSQLGEEVEEVFPALWGIFTFHNVRGEYSRSHEVACEALHRAERLRDPAILVLAHRMMAPPLVQRGELEAARHHLEEMRALYDPLRDHESASRFGVDFKAGGVAFLGQTMFVLGYADQALSLAREAVRHAESLGHSTSISFALNWLTLVHCLRREPEATLEQAERAMALSREHGLTQWLVSAKVRHGHALVELGEIGKGLATVREAMDEFRAMDSRLYRPFNVAAMAVGAASSGAADEAMRLIDEALDETEQTSERWSEAEIQRLKGVLLLSGEAPDARARAEQCFERSLEVARRQSARAWELRTATDLAKLWHEQGKRDDARELLAPIYNWFTEGFDTSDLKDAKALLDSLP